jgi:hypothetical protein
MKILHLLSIILSIQDGLAQPLTPVQPLEEYVWDHILNDYNEIKNNLDETFNRPISCAQIGKKQIASCKFSDFCNSFAPNKNFSYLYENEDGGKIPNQRLAEMEKKLSYCYHTISLKEQEIEKNANESNYLMSMQRDMEEKQKNVQKKFSEFLLEVHKKDESSAYVKYEMKINEIPESDNIVPGTEFFIPVMNEEVVGSEFDQKWKEANDKVAPEEIKKKYIAFQLALNQPLVSYSEHQVKEEPIVGKSVNQNPFVNLSLFFDKNLAGGEDKLQENKQKMEAANERAERIFAATQNDIIRILEERKKSSNKDTEQLNYLAMIDRIRTVEFRKIMLKDYNLEQLEGTCPSPNAFYQKFSHSFTLCPQIMEYPEMSLKTVIAHELAHSIDPCNMAYPIEKNDTVHRVVNLKDNPFDKVFKCLGSSASLDARTSDKDLSKKQLQQAMDFIKKQEVDKYESSDYKNLQQVRDNFDSFYGQYGACSFLPGKSQMQEAWSDWVAAEVVAEDVRKTTDDVKKTSVAFEAVGFFTSSGCDLGKLDIEEQVEKFLKDVGCMEKSVDKDDLELGYILFANELDNHEHSHGYARVEKLFLAHPEIGSSLGCNPKRQGRYCE